MRYVLFVDNHAEPPPELLSTLKNLGFSDQWIKNDSKWIGVSTFNLTKSQTHIHKVKKHAPSEIVRRLVLFLQLFCASETLSMRSVSLKKVKLMKVSVDLESLEARSQGHYLSSTDEVPK